VKFSCERCGKKYATAEPPAAGKVYKLKCKGCGHLIVIRVPGTAGATTGTPAPGRGSAALRSGAPAAPARRGNGARAGAPRISTEDTSRVSIAAAARTPTPAPAEIRPPDPGYIDLFSDLSAPGVGDSAGSPKSDDALRAAARASLPEAYPAAADPLAPLGGANAAPGAALPVPQVPEIAAPPRRRSTVLVVLIGVGVAVVAGILVFVLLGSGARTPPATQRPPPPAAADRGEQAPPPQGAQPGR
jgi:DNA-directed RNA polymerase subunit RPC12/RpoP